MELTKKDVKKIWLETDAVCLETKSGLTGKIPFVKCPLLRDATPAQRKNFTKDNWGINWADIDEDLSYESFFYTD
jgi:hypothetical protein